MNINLQFNILYRSHTVAHISIHTPDIQYVTFFFNFLKKCRGCLLIKNAEINTIIHNIPMKNVRQELNLYNKNKIEKKLTPRKYCTHTLGIT